ncbi:hypothetical protein DT065_03800 [Salicibibacter kimchii]|uniref:Uncharacterized protein n=1 Tax=Salicibibacter kimchii TaxID=2099786 RepID=A0A345BW97_9BACI|nr:hypothetical protein DT065_03800 [Salicibibacter kimchii]
MIYAGKGTVRRSPTSQAPIHVALTSHVKPNIPRSSFVPPYVLANIRLYPYSKFSLCKQHLSAYNAQTKTTETGNHNEANDYIGG